MYETLELEVRDGVAHLTLNRPEAANGISLELARDLMQATLAIADDPGARVVLLSGAGPRFCGGGDLKSFAAYDDLAAHLREVLAYLHVAMAQLVRGDAPVVAAVQGSAAGAGMGLVGASDFVVAGESAKFVMAYTGVGLTPDGASSWFLPRLVGLRRAIELTLTNPCVLTRGRSARLGASSPRWCPTTTLPPPPPSSRRVSRGAPPARWPGPSASCTRAWKAPSSRTSRVKRRRSPRLRRAPTRPKASPRSSPNARPPSSRSGRLRAVVRPPAQWVAHCEPGYPARSRSLPGTAPLCLD